MKELEKTKRISISAILFILIIFIGVLSFKRPKNVFKNDKNISLNHIIKQDYILQIKDLDSINGALIDIRSPYEYDKGYIKNAVNIYVPDLLESEQLSYIKQLDKENKIIVLYGKNPEEANGAWLLLTQLGLKNIKVLCVKLTYKNDKLIVENYPLEKPTLNYAEFMKKASSGKIKIVKKAPRKVIKLIKKKKKVAEGGC
ncbi:rhodanese-like domain-containing protein [Lutibacter sp.]|uniref:rhodanese-like domain-containing protein n=1 Tax=Lutibacter sp. TaxID=1925666 RepID=UPI0025BAAEAA|nr:rhodanese-like domain-containing protein [Lutibacter sp.]MCF6167750.1 rhodanese-like domain-containing protein [Lutibacter sp.]